MPKPTEFHAAFSRALEGISPKAVTLDETVSTMDDARALARDGAPHGTVVVSDHQTAGRGRAGRGWVARRGESLLASWIARPSLPPERWTLVPIIAGVAAARAVRERAKVEAVLKWPNDVLVGERKLAGILAEAEVPRFVIVGIGLNVSRLEFPPDLVATSLAIEGAVRLDRADLLAAILRSFTEMLAQPDAALETYRLLCSSLHRAVRVERAERGPLEGIAVAVGDSGELVLETPGGLVPVASGDVVHLRHTEP